jgi:hypothetical protein
VAKMEVANVFFEKKSGQDASPGGYLDLAMNRVFFDYPC